MRIKLKLALLLSIFTILLSVLYIPTQVSASKGVIQTIKIKPGETKKLKVPSHYTNNTNETMYLLPELICPVGVTLELTWFLSQERQRY